MSIVSRGAGDGAAKLYAQKRITAVLHRVDEPVLFTRVTLTRSGDPAQNLPTSAGVSVDINGDVVHAHVDAHTVYEAVDLLAARLRDRIEHRAQHRLARRRRAGVAKPGERRVDLEGLGP
jgi:ribosome-associated translation inhibitor RaiA